MDEKKDYIETVNGVSFKMIFVEGGDVLMGENKEHRVTVPDFYMAETPCTQELWHAVMDKDYRLFTFKGNEYPVNHISWDDVVLGTTGTSMRAFLKELNGKATQRRYQLPSEAMWQFAAQGGNLANDYEYAGSNNLKEVGWFHENSHRDLKPVKQKLPNELGLYDMSGNVWEWCTDGWRVGIETIPINGIPNKNKENTRVIRGGSWFSKNHSCQVKSRNRSIKEYTSNDICFRLSKY